MSEFGEWEVNEHLQHFANYYSLGQRIWSTLHPKVTQEDVNQAITEVGPHIYGLLISAALLMQIRDRISGYLTRTISILRRLWDHVKYRNTHQAKEIYDKMLRDPSNFTSQDKDKLEALNASRDILGEQIDSTFKKLECLQEAICEIEELQSKATAKAALRHAYLTGICSELDALDAYYKEMESLAITLLHIFAVALDLPNEHYFEQQMDHHMSALRVLNYYEFDKI